MWGKSKNAKKRELRVYFATDLHGSEVCFRKFLAAARVYEADVIILGGDFAGKPTSASTGTMALPAKSPPRMITSASYTLAAVRNLRKQTSDPWRSVAK